LQTRLKELLSKAEQEASGAELRLLRIVHVLEHIHTAEARQFLDTIAQGGYGPVPAAAAQTSLKEWD
jgi:hypothetical protein